MAYKIGFPNVWLVGHTKIITFHGGECNFLLVKRRTRGQRGLHMYPRRGINVDPVIRLFVVACSISPFGNLFVDARFVFYGLATKPIA